MLAPHAQESDTDRTTRARALTRRLATDQHPIVGARSLPFGQVAELRVASVHRHPTLAQARSHPPHARLSHP